MVFTFSIYHGLGFRTATIRTKGSASSRTIIARSRWLGFEGVSFAATSGEARV